MVSIRPMPVRVIRAEMKTIERKAQRKIPIKYLDSLVRITKSRELKIKRKS